MSSVQVKSPSSNSRNIRTKDKLKHSRNETRRRARIRDQFDHLKDVIQCEKKDRFNILQSAVDVVQSLQDRIIELEGVIEKYEAHTKVRFPVSQVVLPSMQPQTGVTYRPHQPAAKRSRVERSAASKKRSTHVDEDEEEDEEEEDEDDEEDGGKRARSNVASDDEGDDDAEEAAAIAQPDAVHAVSVSVGSTLSSNLLAPPTSTVTSGTSSQAVNVLATLASVASASTASSSSAPSSKTASGVARKATPPSSTVGRKRKLDIVKTEALTSTTSTTTSLSLAAPYANMQMSAPVMSTLTSSMPYQTTAGGRAGQQALQQHYQPAPHQLMFNPATNMYSHSQPNQMRMTMAPIGYHSYYHPGSNVGAFQGMSAAHLQQQMPQMMGDYSSVINSQNPSANVNQTQTTQMVNAQINSSNQPNFFYNNTVTAAS